MRDVEFDGETDSIAGWARKLGITRERMRTRLKTLPLKEALTTPKGSISEEGQRRMLSARRERMNCRDALIEKAMHAGNGIPSDVCMGVLLRQGVDFEGDVNHVRNQVITRASARGLAASTRMNDETSFWLIVFQN